MILEASIGKIIEGSEEDKINFKRPKNRHQHDDFSRRQIHSLDYCYDILHAKFYIFRNENLFLSVFYTNIISLSHSSEFIIIYIGYNITIKMKESVELAFSFTTSFTLTQSQAVNSVTVILRSTHLLDLRAGVTPPKHISVSTGVFI